MEIYIYLKAVCDKIVVKETIAGKKELDKLTITFSVDCCRRESGCPSTKHCHVVPNQKYPQTLPQVVMMSRAVGCQRPKVSTAIGKKVKIDRNDKLKTLHKTSTDMNMSIFVKGKVKNN